MRYTRRNGTHTHKRTHIHTYIHTNIHTHKHTHIRTYINTIQTNTHTHTHTHAHAHTHTHTRRPLLPVSLSGLGGTVFGGPLVFGLVNVGLLYSIYTITIT